MTVRTREIWRSGGGPGILGAVLKLLYALEQRRAQLLLQLLDAARQRGLREAQAARGLGDRTAARDLGEAAQELQAHISENSMDMM